MKAPRFITCRQCGRTLDVRFRSVQVVQKYCSSRCARDAQRGRRRPIRYITCQRPGCGQIREVNRPCEQRTRKFCSKRCANLVVCNVTRNGNHRLGVEKSVATRKRKVLARVEGLSPLQAFKLGYKCGIESKCRQIRKHYILTKRTAA